MNTNIHSYIGGIVYNELSKTYEMNEKAFNIGIKTTLCKRYKFNSINKIKRHIRIIQLTKNIEIRSFELGVICAYIIRNLYYVNNLDTTRDKKTTYKHNFKTFINNWDKSVLTNTGIEKEWDARKKQCISKYISSNDNVLDNKKHIKFICDMIEWAHHDYMVHSRENSKSYIKNDEQVKVDIVYEIFVCVNIVILVLESYKCVLYNKKLAYTTKDINNSIEGNKQDENKNTTGE